MKKPNPINYENESDYIKRMIIYEEHMRHEQWKGCGTTVVVALGIIVGFAFAAVWVWSIVI